MDSLLSTLQHKLEGAPTWAAWVGIAVFGVAFLWAARRALFGTKGRANGLLSFLNEMGPQGKIALTGVVVSLYGLWGFGRETAQLPVPIRVGFVTMFDIVELSLFGMLYKRSRPVLGPDGEEGEKPKWTRGMRTMHYTAWGLVVFSAWANVVHAPNLASAPFMALMPAGAAWVVELELRDRMGGKDAVEESSTGPFKLVAALWRRRWAETYARLGVDPTNRDSDHLVKVAAARNAARQLFVLREMLTQSAAAMTGKVEQGRAQRRTALKALEQLQAQREETRVALERARFGPDSQQALEVLRGLAGWTRQDDIAMVDTGDAEKVETLMEEVAIMPSARKIEAAGHAAAAESARQDAERARQEAEQAKKDLERAKTEAAKAVELAEKKAEELRALGVDVNRAREDAKTARQNADRARQDAESEMADLSTKLDTLRQQVSDASDLVAKAAQKRKEMESAGLTAAGQKEKLDGEIQTAAEQLEKLQRAVAALTEQHGEAARKAREAGDAAERLEGELKELQERSENERATAELQAAATAEADRAAKNAAARAEVLALQVREAELALDDLRQTIRAELPEEELEGLDLDGIAFPGSAAKQEAWEEYLSQVTNGLPTLDAKALSERYSVTVGRAREWRVHFRSRRLRMIAAEAAERTPDGAERGAEDAERGAEGSRAAAIPAPAPLVDPGVFAAHQTAR
ncbi:hypothetical protein ACIGZJ_36165 [Kitasatospora sp. NPDC052868]|uniref:hypothetical protein n=1 Tax=Kitasatospora sp. NPDC052868 TaxID=3364060 RepID=UPI0037C8509F